MINLSGFDSAVFPLLRPASPPSDLTNRDYLEDMRSRVGELAQLARCSPDAEMIRFTDQMESAHDFLVKLTLQAKWKEVAPA